MKSACILPLSHKRCYTKFVVHSVSRRKVHTDYDITLALSYVTLLTKTIHPYLLLRELLQELPETSREQSQARAANTLSLQLTS
jgi:hypothetical protein